MTFKKKPVRGPYVTALQMYDYQGRPISAEDNAIMNARVRAFVDGVNWERRRRYRASKTGDEQ